MRPPIAPQIQSGLYLLLVQIQRRYGLDMIISELSHPASIFRAGRQINARRQLIDPLAGDGQGPPACNRKEGGKGAGGRGNGGRRQGAGGGGRGNEKWAQTGEKVLSEVILDALHSNLSFIQPAITVNPIKTL